MPTYTPLQSIQLASSSSSVIFSNIPQNYQDLVLVLNAIGTTATNDIDINATFNGDSSSLYSNTRMYALGSASSGQRGSGLAYWRLGNMAGSGSYSTYTPLIINIQNYSNTTTNKVTIGRSSNPERIIDFYVNLYRSTSAITSISLSATFGAGSTFDLYGISPVAANNAQAFGGTDIYYDSTYVYHVFKGSGTFTPYRNLTCDYAIVAGGAGARFGGGGAGGFRAFTGASLTSGTSYPVVLGAGGSGATNGTSTSFNSNSVSGGGTGTTGASNGTSGGSGGGAGSVSGDGAFTGGSGNAGSYSPVEGYAGGNAVSTGAGTGGANAGGGGGAGGVGGNGSNSGGTSGGTGGAGGIGSNTYNSINISSWLTITGTGSGGYVSAGGAGGGTGSGVGSSGITNTGNGARANNWSDSGISQNGGSGLVIIRYAR